MVSLRYKDFVAKQLRNVGMIHTQRRGIFPGLLCSIRILCVVNVSGKQCRSFQRKNTFHHPPYCFFTCTVISIVLTYQKNHLVEYYLVGARSCEATRYCLGLPGFNMIGLPAQRDGIREGYSA